MYKCCVAVGHGGRTELVCRLTSLTSLPRAAVRPQCPSIVKRNLGPPKIDATHKVGLLIDSGMLCYGDTAAPLQCTAETLQYWDSSIVFVPNQPWTLDRVFDSNSNTAVCPTSRLTSLTLTRNHALKQSNKTTL